MREILGRGKIKEGAKRRKQEKQEGRKGGEIRTERNWTLQCWAGGGEGRQASEGLRKTSRI